eukprot:3040952-Prymnesium_polylepis.1
MKTALPPFGLRFGSKCRYTTRMQSCNHAGYGCHARRAYGKTFCGNVLILPDTQEGAEPHRDWPARIPWSVGVRVRVHHARV